MSRIITADIQRWEHDVDEEAARLIRLGVPPYDAIIQARQRIAAQRRREHGQKDSA